MCICVVLTELLFLDMMEKIYGSAGQENGIRAEQSHTHELISLRSDLDSEIALNKKYIEQLDGTLSKLSKLKLETVNHYNKSRVNNFQKRCETLKIQIRYASLIRLYSLIYFHDFQQATFKNLLFVYL